jgi:hypothetical protein
VGIRRQKIRFGKGRRQHAESLNAVEAKQDAAFF